MAIEFYMMPVSGPCRSVLMLMKELDIPHETKVLDLLKGEQKNPDFVAINPQHCVPTIVDDGFVLWESRAILTYLVSKFAPESALYPTDVQQRAKIDRLLYFDIGTLYKAQSEVIYPLLFGSSSEIDEDKSKTLREKLGYLNGWLGESKNVAGDDLTVADLAILSSITFLSVIDFDISEFENIVAWRDRLAEELPYYKEVNEEPLGQFKAWYEAKKAGAAAAADGEAPPEEEAPAGDE